MRARWNEDKYGKKKITDGGEEKQKALFDSSAVNYPPLQSSSPTTCRGRGFKQVTKEGAWTLGERWGQRRDEN